MRICHDDRWCADAAAAGGMENMDLAPYLSRGARDVLDRDGMIGARNFGGPCGLAWYRSSAVGPWTSDGAASSPLFPRGRRGAEFRPGCRAFAHRATALEPTDPPARGRPRPPIARAWQPTTAPGRSRHLFARRGAPDHRQAGRGGWRRAPLTAALLALLKVSRANPNRVFAIRA
jgi:hypothetical protein